MVEHLSPIDRYHHAGRRGDTREASASLLLAGQLSAYRAEAHLLNAMEAMRGKQWHAAFLHGAQAAVALTHRAEPKMLVARAVTEQGRPELAARILEIECPAVAADEPAPVFIAPLPVAKRQDALVNVLIPVYAGYRQTMECIHSVLRHASDNLTAHHVVVLDDASPDQALARELQALAASSTIEYIRRDVNLGFIRNMNLGMALHPWRDVVWLNADTRVHGDWLDRLRASALHSDRTASATPLSNHGELMSFPASRVQHPMPDRAAHAQLDKLARTLAEEVPPVVETGCGFCMYIKRDALQAIGLLDETGLTRGYGEDTDWCVRARAAGWQHVAATRVFVAHAGGVSFGAEKALRVRQNNAVLRRRYPDAEARFDLAILRDPLLPARHQLQRARLGLLREWIAASGPCPALAPTNFQSQKRLHITGPAPVGEMDEASSPIVLRFRNQGQVTCVSLQAMLPPLPLQIDYRLPEEASQLIADLRSLPLECLVYGRLRACPSVLMELPEVLGLPHIVRCDDDTLVEPGSAGFGTRARFVELPWRALFARYRNCLPGVRLKCAPPQRAPKPTAELSLNHAAPLLIADSLDQPEVCLRWLTLARQLVRQGSPTKLLLNHPTPWENELVATGAVVPVPRLPGLGTQEFLRLAGCVAAVSLDDGPGAGWTAPGLAQRYRLGLYAPDSAVAREAGSRQLLLAGLRLAPGTTATRA